MCVWMFVCVCVCLSDFKVLQCSHCKCQMMPLEVPNTQSLIHIPFDLPLLTLFLLSIPSLLPFSIYLSESIILATFTHAPLFLSVLPNPLHSSLPHFSLSLTSFSAALTTLTVDVPSVPWGKQHDDWN